jgi:acyl-CoA synthetase (AMP-forming)/AMP-acid ligase II
MKHSLNRSFPCFDAAVRYHSEFSLASRIRFPDQENREVSYKELYQLSRSCEKWIVAAGVKREARVALVMAPRLETVAAILALLRLHVTFVPLVFRSGLRPGSQPFIAADSALRIGRPQWLLCPQQDIPQYSALAVHSKQDIRVEPVELVAGNNHAVEGESLDVPRNGPAIIQMSSGSTARSKGIWLTEVNLLRNVAAIQERLGGSSHDRVYSWLPLHHDMGLVGALLTSIHAGASLVLASGQSFVHDPLSWIRGLSDSRSTITMGPPSAYALAQEKVASSSGMLPNCDLSFLRVALIGAEPVSYDTCRAFEAAFLPYGLNPHVLQPCYGLAENCVAVTMRNPGTPLAHHSFDRGSLDQDGASLAESSGKCPVPLLGNGAPVAGSEVLIAHKSNGRLIAAEVGEIYIRGDAAAVMIVDSDGKACEMARGGWIPTGDIGTWAGEELYIVGRTKEIIKRGGRVLVPFDIESTVAELLHIPPGIVAAVGIFDEASQREEVVLFVEAKNDSSLEGKIRLRVLETFQLPLFDIVFLRRGSLPRTLSGKVKRLELGHNYRLGKFRPPQSVA